MNDENDKLNQKLRYFLHFCNGRIEQSHESYSRPLYTSFSEWNIRVGDQDYTQHAYKRIPVINLIMPEDRLESLIDCVDAYNSMHKQLGDALCENLTLKETIDEHNYLRNTYPEVAEEYKKYMDQVQKYKVLEILKT
jgi:hypothetical protein